MTKAETLSRIRELARLLDRDGIAFIALRDLERSADRRMSRERGHRHAAVARESGCLAREGGRHCESCTIDVDYHCTGADCVCRVSGGCGEGFLDWIAIYNTGRAIRSGSLAPERGASKAHLDRCLLIVVSTITDRTIAREQRILASADELQAAIDQIEGLS